MTQIKRMKSFIWIFFISLFTFILFYVLLYHTLVNKDLYISHSYKQFLLEHTKSPRLIVDSGSNSQHSINSQMLEQELGILTINIADNGGYPLKEKLLRIEKYARPGDIVLLPLEWGHYSYTMTNKAFIDNIFDRLNFYYLSVPTWNKVELIGETPFPTIVKAVISKRKEFFTDVDSSKLQSEYLQLKDYLAEFDRGSRGDYKYYGPLEIANDGTKIKSCNEYVLGEQLTYGFVLSDVFKENIEIVKRLQSKGIKVIFTWPAVTGDDCYAGQYKAQFHAFVREIKTYLFKNHIPMIGDPYDSRMEGKYMLNTYYHVIPKARDIRTKRLIKRIKDSKLLYTNKSNKIYDDSLNALPDLKKKLLISLQSISKNQTIDFRKKDFQNNVVLIDGWYPLEEGGVWSKGDTSKLLLKLDKSLESKSINIKLYSLLFEDKNSTTTLFINNNKLGEYRLDGMNEIKISKQYTQTKNGFIEIEFKHHNVKSPAEYGMNDDGRKLKLRLVELKVMLDEK